MILQGKGYRMLGNDFLVYKPLHCFNLIVMNPPFSNGDEHLLHAWDIMHTGDIVCLLNADTIKNPYTQRRKLLAKIIEQNGSVEMLGNCFSTAEHRTNVDVAMVRLHKEVEDERWHIDFGDNAKMEKMPNFAESINTGSELALNDKLGSYLHAWKQAQVAAQEFIKARKKLEFYVTAFCSVEEVGKLVAAGYKEVVLIGIHLGCYGKELAKEGKHVTLYDAVKAALSVEGVQRVRLGSLESVEVEPRLLQLMAEEPRLQRHLHLPLQSGCDKILRAMHRPYDTKRFTELVNEIRAQVPDVAITTDVIVGFPGETEEDFATTLEFAKKCGFAKMHIFPYSKRKGTPAAEMPEQVDEAVKSERAACLAKVDEELHQQMLQSTVGKVEEVLFEQPVDDEHMEGLCGPYLRVVVPGTAELANTIVKVKITGIKEDFLLGELN